MKRPRLSLSERYAALQPSWVAWLNLALLIAALVGLVFMGTQLAQSLATFVEAFSDEESSVGDSHDAVPLSPLGEALGAATLRVAFGLQQARRVVSPPSPGEGQEPSPADDL